MPPFWTAMPSQAPRVVEPPAGVKWTRLRISPGASAAPATSRAPPSTSSFAPSASSTTLPSWKTSVAVAGTRSVPLTW